MPLRIWTDGESAMGTAGRQGLGKLRHLECHSLWLQQRMRRKEFALQKVPGEQNPADLFTNHLESAKKLEQLLGLYSYQFEQGRAASAPKLKKADPEGRPGLPGSSAAFAKMIALPHLQPKEEIEAQFPAAAAQMRRTEKSTRLLKMSWVIQRLDE